MKHSLIFSRNWMKPIIAGVCIYYRVKESDLRLSRKGYFSEPRNVGIYLLRHLRNDSLREVGEVFKIYTYSTISSIVERVKQERGRNKNLKKRIDELNKNICKSQRQTCPHYKWIRTITTM